MSVLQSDEVFGGRALYLLAVVEEEQRWVTSHAVLRAHFVVLRAVHLSTHTEKHFIDKVSANAEQICLLRVFVKHVIRRVVL